MAYAEPLNGIYNTVAVGLFYLISPASWCVEYALTTSFLSLRLSCVSSFFCVACLLCCSKKCVKPKSKPNPKFDVVTRVVTEWTTPSNVMPTEAAPTSAPPVDESAGGGAGSSTSDCRSDEFQCDDGSCVGRHFRCDNVPDCSDASDEDNCSTFSFVLPL